MIKVGYQLKESGN